MMFEKEFDKFWKQEVQCFSPEFLWTSEEKSEIKRHCRNAYEQGRVEASKERLYKTKNPGEK